MDTASIEKQIKDIEDEIFNTQKNKATEHHIGKLKAKIARLREEAEKIRSKGGKGKGFALKKSGDATVGLIGFPSVGKSTLLNQLTRANSDVGAYDFTTLNVIPGMMIYKGANIQMLDLPGLVVGASKGRGRGREILSAIRNVDLLLFLIDAKHRHHLAVMADELHEAGLRLNQKKPDVVVKKTGQGGLTVNSTVKLSYLNEKIIKSICSEYVINAHILIREDITEDQLIDVFVQNRVYVPALVVINKMDLVPPKVIHDMVQEIHRRGWNTLAISALEGKGLDELREAIFSGLRFIRVYMKPAGKKPDYTEPLIVRKGATVEDACRMLHRDFKRKFRYAQVWGQSAKYPGQTVGLDHVFEDEDVLTIIITR